jgi:hypothetical protein
MKSAHVIAAHSCTLSERFDNARARLLNVYR